MTALPVLVAVALTALSCLVSIKLTPAAMLSIYVVPVAFLAWWARVVTTTATARIEADALVLTTEGATRRVPFTKVAAAYVRGPCVVMELRDRTVIQLEARDGTDARAMLLALGFDASQRRAEFNHSRIFYTVIAWMLGPLGGALTTALILKSVEVEWMHTTAFALGLFALLSAALIWLMQPKLDVVVGSDGLLIHRKIGRRFISWSDVEEVRQGQGEFLLKFRKGRLEGFWCNPDDDAVLPSVCARIREALSAFHTHGSSDPIGALDRGGRSLDVWKSDLARLLNPVTDYRSPIIDRARVVALLEDPTSTVERRVGAALSLAQSAGEDGRTRVRIAAEQSADPAEREALARIADGDAQESHIEAALKRGR